jgi:hypothetical protein
MADYKLSISMVPAPLWGENLRKRLTRGGWNALRADQFARVPNCESCGSSPLGAERHAHEEWVYNAKAGVARLVGLRTTCRMCHFAEHPGFVNVMVANGRFTPAILREIERHCCRVNGCKPQDYRRHQEQAQRKYEKLMKVAAWSINFGPYADLVAGDTMLPRCAKSSRSTPGRRRVRTATSVLLSDGAAT